MPNGCHVHCSELSVALSSTTIRAGGVATTTALLAMGPITGFIYAPVPLPRVVQVWNANDQLPISLSVEADSPVSICAKLLDLGAGLQGHPHLREMHVGIRKHCASSVLSNLEDETGLLGHSNRIAPSQPIRSHPHQKPAHLHRPVRKLLGHAQGSINVANCIGWFSWARLNDSEFTQVAGLAVENWFTSRERVLCAGRVREGVCSVPASRMKIRVR